MVADVMSNNRFAVSYTHLVSLLAVSFFMLLVGKNLLCLAWEPLPAQVDVVDAGKMCIRDRATSTFLTIPISPTMWRLSGRRVRSIAEKDVYKRQAFTCY